MILAGPCFGVMFDWPDWIAGAGYVGAVAAWVLLTWTRKDQPHEVDLAEHQATLEEEL